MKTRESGKIFLACAIGAGIGSLVALEMIKPLWWIGLLVGGLVGYLSYEWRAVLQAIPAAYRAARGWKAPPRFFAGLGWGMLACLSTGFWAALFGELLNMAQPPEQKMPQFGCEVIGIFIALLSFIILGGFFTSMTLSEGYPKLSRDHEINGYRWVACKIFPPFVLFWYLPRGVIWLGRRLPRAIVAFAYGCVGLARFLRRFGWELFLRVHSEKRLLCGVDAMLGAAVGYFAGSALIGALAGGCFGLVNYVFVTEHWLKRRGYLPVRPN